MPKYNPKNKQHRKTLATRITKMLVAAGYSPDKKARSKEDVYRLDIAGVKKGSAYVRVSTSIVNGEMRTAGVDAIRVYAVYENAGKSRGLVKTTAINRTGGMQAITGRLLVALRKTKRVAGKRANDPGFHALPVKTYAKKRWTPKGKKVDSKPKAAKKLNSALKAKADADSPLASHTFTVGQLVEFHSADFHKGIVRAVNGPSILVFWFSTGDTSTCTTTELQPLAA